MAIPLFQLLPSIISTGLTLFNRPRREEFMPNLDFLKRHIANLRGRRSDQEVANLITRAGQRQVGAQTARLKRGQEAFLAKHGLTGSGIAAQLDISRSQQALGALEQVGERATAAQIEERRRITGQIDVAQLQLGAAEAQAGLQFRQAQAGQRRAEIGAFAQLGTAAIGAFRAQADLVNSLVNQGVIQSAAEFNEFKKTSGFGTDQAAANALIARENQRRSDAFTDFVLRDDPNIAADVKALNLPADTTRDIVNIEARRMEQLGKQARAAGARLNFVSLNKRLENKTLTLADIAASAPLLTNEQTNTLATNLANQQRVELETEQANTANILLARLDDPDKPLTMEEVLRERNIDEDNRDDLITKILEREKGKITGVVRAAQEALVDGDPPQRILEFLTLAKDKTEATAVMEIYNQRLNDIVKSVSVANFTPAQKRSFDTAFSEFRRVKRKLDSQAFLGFKIKPEDLNELRFHYDLLVGMGAALPGFEQVSLGLRGAPEPEQALQLGDGADVIPDTTQQQAEEAAGTAGALPSQQVLGTQFTPEPNVDLTQPAQIPANFDVQSFVANAPPDYNDFVKQALAVNPGIDATRILSLYLRQADPAILEEFFR